MKYVVTFGRTILSDHSKTIESLGIKENDLLDVRHAKIEVDYIETSYCDWFDQLIEISIW